MLAAVAGKEKPQDGSASFPTGDTGASHVQESLCGAQSGVAASLLSPISSNKLPRGRENVSFVDIHLPNGYFLGGFHTVCPWQPP